MCRWNFSHVVPSGDVLILILSLGPRLYKDVGDREVLSLLPGSPKENDPGERDTEIL